MLCLALTAAAAGATAAQEWETFAPPNGGFSISMPGKPAMSDQEVPTRVGKLNNRMYLLESGQGVYMVSYADFPDPVTDPVTIKAMLDNARDKAAKSSGNQLKEEKEITLEGYPGRDWLVSIPGGILRARAFWVRNQRLYQAVVLMPAGKDAEAEKAREATMMKFLNSFGLTSAGVTR